MAKDSSLERDSLATFREYMSLERRRSAGFSQEDWERWQLLRKKLDGAFGGLEIPGGCSGRRATPRVPTALAVRFETLNDMRCLLLTNLSRGGIFVPTSQPAEIGTDLTLWIKVAVPPRELKLCGEVVSKNVGPAFETPKRGMGIRFKSLSADDQALVDELYEQQIQQHLESD